MANYNDIKAAIEAAIYENGTQAITGDILQGVLLEMVGTFGAFSQFGGVATPATDPGQDLDEKVIYLATTPGRYDNMGNLSVLTGETALLVYSGSWSKVTLPVLSNGAGAINTSNLADNAVNANKILNGAVLTGKIQDGAVTADKLAADAVATGKIQDGAITSAKVAAGAVTEGKLAAGSVSSEKLATGAVVEAKIQDGAVSTGKLSDNAVTGAKIANGTITGAKIANGAVDTTQVANGAITYAKIADGAVNANKIADDGISYPKIINGAIKESKIATGAVTTGKIANGAVTAAKLADGAINGDKLADGSILAAKVGNGEITGAKIANGAVSEAKIVNGAVTTDKIGSEAVTSSKIAAGAVGRTALSSAVKSELDAIPGKASQADLTQLALQVGANKSDIEAIPFSYMAGARVGTSDDLTPDNVATSETIKERIAGGTQTIKKGSALVERVKGNSLVWNQFVNLTGYSAQSCTVVKDIPNFKLTLTSTIGRNQYAIVNYLKVLLVGNKYLFATKSDIASVIFRFGNNGNFGYATSAESPYFFTAQYNTIGFGFASAEIGETHWFEKPQLIDLTQMFGAGNEPTTIAEFESRCPKVANPYEYNAGTIVGMTAEGVQCTGVNLWDEEWEKGAYLIETGEKVASGERIRCKNLVSVTPSTAYYFKSSNSGVNDILFYDANKTYISYNTRTTGSFQFTTPANCHYIVFGIWADYGNTYKHDICISVRNPATNGNYYPYSASARTWGNILTSAFGGVMHAVGNVYDEIGLTRAVKRVGVVDLGSLTWTMSGGRFASNVPSGAYYNGTSSTAQTNAIVSNDYTFVGIYQMYDKVVNKSINVGVGPSGGGSNTSINVYDTTYTTAEAFKASLNGVYLVYELATPTETTYDELAMTYKATPNGMESMVAEGASAPLKADIVYPINAQGSIRNNSTAIGTLSNLATTAKSDLVSAINELYNMISNG